MQLDVGCWIWTFDADADVDQSYPSLGTAPPRGREEKEWTGQWSWRDLELSCLF
jgi:hypothetical protein